MNYQKSSIILIIIISGVFIRCTAQTSSIHHSTTIRKKDLTFYKNYLAIRERHSHIDTNTFAGEAITGKKNTYIEKQLNPKTDPSTYHSYWPVQGDSLIYISPITQKLCVVDEIDSCEVMTRKYTVKKNGNETNFYFCDFFDCAIKARNLANLDFEKERGCDVNQSGFVFKFRKGERYKSITNEHHIHKIVDSLKKIHNYITLSHPKGSCFNLKKGILTSYPGAKDTLCRFDIQNIIYVNNNIRYIEIHFENNNESEEVQVYLYSKSELVSVTYNTAEID